MWTWIPEGKKKETELSFFHLAVQKANEKSIPEYLIINSEQKPSKFVPILSSTLTECSSNQFKIKGSDKKRAMTLLHSPLKTNFFECIWYNEVKLLRAGHNTNFRLNFPSIWTKSITIIRKSRSDLLSRYFYHMLKRNEQLWQILTFLKVK